MKSRRASLATEPNLDPQGAGERLDLGVAEGLRPTVGGAGLSAQLSIERAEREIETGSLAQVTETHPAFLESGEELLAESLRHAGITTQSVVDCNTTSLCVDANAYSLAKMPAKNGVRGQRIPVPRWWWNEARKRLVARGDSYDELADDWSEDWSRRRTAGVLEWWETDDPQPSAKQVERCLHPKAFSEDPKSRRRWVPTLEAVTALSRILEVTCPVFLAATESEATMLRDAQAKRRAETPTPVADHYADSTSPESGEAGRVVGPGDPDGATPGLRRPRRRER